LFTNLPRHQNFNLLLSNILRISRRHLKSNKKPVKVFIIVPAECYDKLEELMQQPALGNRGNIALLKYG